MLLIAVAGCTLDSFLNPQIVVWGPKVTVSCPVAEVATKLRNGLSEEGLLVRTNRMGSDYRISSQWKSGTVFCLHLQQVSEEDGVKTRVRMQWDRGGDKELWQLILKILNASSDEEGSANSQREPLSSP
jgi:hypothetical protein